MTFCELALLVALTILVLALAVIAFFGYRRNWQWTGLPKYGDDDVERRYVTLWAWISVLLVPLTLAAAGVLFTGAQHRSSSAIQQQQREDDLAVQESRTQDERLREYIGKLGTLLVEGDLDTKGYYEAWISGRLETLHRSRSTKQRETKTPNCRTGFTDLRHGSS
jgi:hypothetical protein